MSALAIIGLGLVGLLLALVLLPFRVRALGAVHGAEPAGGVRLEWAWGLVGFEAGNEGAALRLLWLRVWRFGARKKGATADEEEKKKKKEEKKGKKKGKKKASGSVLARLRAGLEHGPALRRMLKRLAATLHFRLVARGVVGTGDPADTALLFGAVRALQELPGVELDLRPDWLDEELEIDARASVRIWIADLLVVVVALLLVRENRAALREVRAAA